MRDSRRLAGDVAGCDAVKQFDLLHQSVELCQGDDRITVFCKDLWRRETEVFVHKGVKVSDLQAYLFDRYFGLMADDTDSAALSHYIASGPAVIKLLCDARFKRPQGEFDEISNFVSMHVLTSACAIRSMRVTDADVTASLDDQVAAIDSEKKPFIAP